MRRTHRLLFVLLASFTAAVQASQMEDLARTLHDSNFSEHVERLLKNNNPSQALELAEIGIKRNARNVQLRFMRSVALDALGRREEAANVLSDIIREFPEIPEPYSNLAVIEAGFGNLEKAEKLLLSALRINPEFALARKNLGDVRLALAIEDYEKAAEALPSNDALKSRLKALERITRSGI